MNFPYRVPALVHLERSRPVPQTHLFDGSSALRSGPRRASRASFRLQLRASFGAAVHLRRERAEQRLQQFQCIVKDAFVGE